MTRSCLNYLSSIALMSFCWAGMAQAGDTQPLDNPGGGTPAGLAFGAKRIPQPPQAALDACNNLTADSSCTFTMDGHQIEGTCRESPNGNVLACVPQGMPPPSPPQPPQAAVDICKNLSLGTACMFTIDDHQIEGICRSFPNSEIIACAPSSMPIPPGKQ